MRPDKTDTAKRAQFLLGHRVLGGLSLFLGWFCVCRDSGQHTHMSPKTINVSPVVLCPWVHV